jgi:ribosome-binding factor A
MSPSRSAPSQRQLRVGELIRHELASIFSRGDVADPEIEWPAITVTEVEMSPDLRFATCYVRSFRTHVEDELAKKLDRHRKYLRGLLSPRLGLKFMPDLRFRMDTAADYAERIDKLLKEPAVARDLGPGGEE